MRKRNAPREYPRTARLNTLLQEIIAEEMDRIDDPRLEMVCITEVDVDADLGRAVAYYDHSLDEEGARVVSDALDEMRLRLQGAVAREARIRRTPELRFEEDEVIRTAARIDEVLAELAEEPPVPPLEDD